VNDAGSQMNDEAQYLATAGTDHYGAT